MARKIKITQIKSGSGHPADQRATVRALGIRRMQQTVVHTDTPQIREDGVQGPPPGEGGGELTS